MIVFSNEGLIDLRAITTFGVCVKPEASNPIGYFGTGLKYAIATLLRNKQKVMLYRGEEQFEFTLSDRYFREEKIEYVYMNGEELPFTVDLGKNWQLWHAYRELMSNAMDENGMVHEVEETDEAEADLLGPDLTHFVVQGDEFTKVHTDENNIFLSTKPRMVLKDVELHDTLDVSKWVYYRGIRVYELPKRGMCNYNLTGKLRLTEDRTLSSISDALTMIAKAIVACEDPALIRAMLLADSRFFESTIDYNWWSVEPGQTFNAVVERLIGGHTGFNSSAREKYRDDHPAEDLPQIVMWESIPIEHRRVLWAALLFWAKLGIEIPKDIVHVTKGIGGKKMKVITGHIYISQDTLSLGMRAVCGLLYQFYADTKPEIGGIKRYDLLLDTLVDFGERILGLTQKKDAA